ncbi:MAG: hypothetical protein ACJ75J_05330 [Cytophagaceae bacterium]
MKPYYKDIDIDRKAVFKLKKGSPGSLEFNEEVKGSVLRLETIDRKTDPLLLDIYRLETHDSELEKLDVWVIMDNTHEEINIPYRDVESVEYLIE